MARLKLDPVYPISDSRNQPGWSHSRLAASYLEAGIRLFQVREKNAPDRLQLDQLIRIRELCREFGACFLVNDRVDLALASEADGVHLGQDDLPAATARRIVGEKAIIGVSTHDAQQFRRALREPVDYLALGPIFATSSKAEAAPLVGLELLEELAAESHLPVVAIGGITLASAPQLWLRGAASVAVISDVNQTSDPGGRIGEYLARAKECRS